jgi:hypothetical protein
LRSTLLVQHGESALELCLRGLLAGMAAVPSARARAAMGLRDRAGLHFAGFVPGMGLEKWKGCVVSSFAAAYIYL